MPQIKKLHRAKSYWVPFIKNLKLEHFVYPPGPLAPLFWAVALNSKFCSQHTFSASFSCFHNPHYPKTQEENTFGRKGPLRDLGLAPMVAGSKRPAKKLLARSWINNKNLVSQIQCYFTLWWTQTHFESICTP